MYIIYVTHVVSVNKEHQCQLQGSWRVFFKIKFGEKERKFTFETNQKRTDLKLV